MRAFRRRSSAVAVAVVMAGSLVVSDPFTQAADARPARRWRPSPSGRLAKQTRASRSGVRSAVPVRDVWARLRRCESGGRYDRNSGNGYYGAYQFLPSTWRRLGFPGMPHEAAPEVQDAAARKLQARSGWGQWPACSRRIGVR